MPVESLALKYDRVENHGWYANLDPTVEELAGILQGGEVVVDYSGGTGILADRLLGRVGSRPVGVVIVDSSPKFLRLALEKLGDEPRVAFRLLRFLKDEKRLQYVDEALGPDLVRRGVDVLVSTNAVHLYHDLPGTFAAWHRVVRTGGRVLVQSGNVRADTNGRWIIDDTVAAIAEEARRIVASDARYARWRDALADAPRMALHDAYRERVFLPARPLAHYLGALRGAGFRVLDVRTRPVLARTREWYQFLSVYVDAILGWVGGTAKVEGTTPDAEAEKDRLDLLRQALDRIVGGKDRFEAVWTYVTCERP